MRYEFGPTCDYTPPAPIAASSSTQKSDPQISHKGWSGNVAMFTVHPYDLATSNKLCEVRIYLVKEGDPTIPNAASGYTNDKTRPFGHADVSGLSGLQSDVDATVTAPAVDDIAAAYKAQYILGYDL